MTTTPPDQQWDHDREQLVAVAFHESEPRPADNTEPAVLRDLERDARGSLGALLAGYSSICSTLSEDALLAAAGWTRERDVQP